MAGDGTKLVNYFKKYFWVLINKVQRIAYFFYDNDGNDSRSFRPIENFFGDYQDTIQSDGYSVYKQLEKGSSLTEHLLCWAYVRAKFKLAVDIAKDVEASWFWSR